MFRRSRIESWSLVAYWVSPYRLVHSLFLRISHWSCSESKLSLTFEWKVHRIHHVHRLRQTQPFRFFRCSKGCESPVEFQSPEFRSLDISWILSFQRVECKWTSTAWQCSLLLQGSQSLIRGLRNYGRRNKWTDFQSSEWSFMAAVCLPGLPKLVLDCQVQIHGTWVEGNRRQLFTKLVFRFYPLAWRATAQQTTKSTTNQPRWASQWKRKTQWRLLLKRLVV